MNIHATLATLGLEQRETDLYLALLKLGPSSIRDIASSAGINRGTSYELLKGLQKKQLVTYYPKGKRRFFCAENPEQLLVLAKEKSDKLQHSIDVLRHEIVPDLSSFQSNDSGVDVRYYEGDDGIEFVLKDILSTVGQSEDQSYSVYSSRLLRKHLYRPFPNYTRQRVQKGIRVKVIAIGEGGEDAPLAERKWIDVSGQEKSASYLAIYPPKVVMISLTERDYPTAVMIESQGIAMAMKFSFDALWQRL